MLKKYSADRTIFPAPMGFMKGNVKLLFQECRSFVAQGIDHVVGPAVLVIVELRTRALQIAVVIEQLQAPQKWLRAAAEKRNDVSGTEKAMSVNQPDDLAVALRQLHGSNQMGAFETGKADRLHLSTLPETTRRRSPQVLPSATSW